MQPIQKCEFTVGNTDVLVIMQGGFFHSGESREVSPHSHSNLEVHYVTGGCSSFFSGESCMSLERDALVVVPPKHYHFFRDGEGAARISFEVKLSRAREGGDTYSEYSTLFDSLTEPRLVEGFLPEFIALRACGGIIRSEEQLCRARANFMLAFLSVAELLRREELPGRGAGDATPALLPTGDENITVIRILNYIYDNFTLHISLSDVAREVNLSERQVQRILADRMREGFHSILTKQRINNARLLLASAGETRSIEEIAYASGFSSYVSFWSHFKRATGESPDEFRRRRRR